MIGNSFKVGGGATTDGRTDNASDVAGKSVDTRDGVDLGKDSCFFSTGVVDSIAGGVAGGVRGGVRSGVRSGVRGGVADSITDGELARRPTPTTCVSVLRRNVWLTI